jgi:TfoX/Sxy family transcriptional regulator of competence genes
MASHPDMLQFITDQAGLGYELTHKRMFGEYALYLRGKVVAFICDDQLFLKPTPEGRAFLREVIEAPPYPGGKNWFLLTRELDNRERLRGALMVTYEVLPEPEAKVPRKKGKPQVTDRP